MIFPVLSWKERGVGQGHCYFDKKKVIGTFVEECTRQTELFCRAYIDRKDIVREDRRELAELVLIYLGNSTLKIRKAGAVHHARFLSKAIYSLKIVLLSKQIDFPDDIIEKFQDVAEFITCFYCIWFLQSHEAARAPFADILSIQQIFRYQKESKHPEAVHKVIDVLTSILGI